MTESDEADSTKIIQLIFTHICVMFANLQYLNFGPSLNQCQELFFGPLGTSPLAVFSSLYQNYIYVCLV